MRIVLAYAFALRQGLFGGGANRGGSGSIYKSFVHLVHHFGSLLHRRSISRQRGKTITAYSNHRLYGRARNGQCRIEPVERLVDFLLDVFVVHKGDAGHRIAEHVVRLGRKAGQHHGIKGIDGGFEFGLWLNLHFDVNHLLARTGGRYAAQLEPVVGDRRAEGQLHLIVEHEFFHDVSCTILTHRRPAHLGIAALQIQWPPHPLAKNVASAYGLKPYHHTIATCQGRLASMFMELSEPMSLMAKALTLPE